MVVQLSLVLEQTIIKLAVAPLEDAFIFVWQID